MNNIFCISFSDIGFQLLHVISNDSENKINSHYQFEYPSVKSPDQIFAAENIGFISSSINQFQSENNIQEFSLSFALPFNFAEIKKVAFPLQSDKNQKRQQIEWELNTTLSGDIKDYKVSVLNENDELSFSSAFVVAIRKEILLKLKHMANDCASHIQNVFLNGFALENYILHNKRYDNHKNFIFLKVDNNFLEYHFFSERQYFSSQIDTLDLLTRSRQEVVLELAHEKYKYISNLFTQANNDNPFELYLYGASMDEEIFKVLRKGLSIPVEYAQIENFPAKGEDYKYIEAWGSIL